MFITLLLNIYYFITITKFLLFKMKYITDGGSLFDD